MGMYLCVGSFTYLNVEMLSCNPQASLLVIERRAEFEGGGKAKAEEFRDSVPGLLHGVDGRMA